MAGRFEQARARFRDEVAATYGKKASSLTIGPESERVVGFDDYNTGDLVPFEATARDLRVRGFAGPDAAVVAGSNALGPLFRAANMLDAAKSLSALELARRIVWMMGPGYQVVERLSDYRAYPVPSEIAPPALDRSAGGAVLRFYFVKLDDHGGPATNYSAEVACSASYEATLVTSEMTPIARATTAFRVLAAKQLGVDASRVEARAVASVTLGKEIDPELAIGRAWPFFAGRIATDALQEPFVRGWATGDGRAITMTANFGVLLEQAGLWAHPPSDELRKLPKALAWALNAPSLIGVFQPSGDPVVELGPDGAGTLTIPFDYQEGGHGGYLSPVMKYRAIARVTADHAATVTVEKLR